MPGGQCVLCPDDIRVLGVSTSSTRELGLVLARIRVHVPALRACLRGVSGVDLADAGAGAPDRISQSVFKAVPALVPDRAVQTGLLRHHAARLFCGPLGGSRHTLDVQILQHDQPVAVDECACRSGLKVGAPATYSPHHRRHGRPQAATARGTFPGSGEATLTAYITLRLTGTDELTVEESSAGLRIGLRRHNSGHHAPVHTDPASRQRDRPSLLRCVHQERELFPPESASTGTTCPSPSNAPFVHRAYGTPCPGPSALVAARAPEGHVAMRTPEPSSPRSLAGPVPHS